MPDPNVPPPAAAAAGGAPSSSPSTPGADHAAAAEGSHPHPVSVLNNSARRAADDAEGKHTGKKVQVVGDLPRPPRAGPAPPVSDEEADYEHAGAAAGESDVDSVRNHTADEDDEDEDDDDIPDSALLDGYDPEDTTYIDLTHIRLLSTNLRGLNLARFPKTENLCLRQNEIAKISAKDVGSLPNLRELDLYDNQIDKVGHHVFEGTPKLE